MSVDYSGTGANVQYEYTLEMFGSFAATELTGVTLPHPVFSDSEGNPVTQLDAIVIGGFNGLNN